MEASRGPSLIFDLFGIGVRLRLLLEAALVDAPLSPDEYAIYSVLFDGGAATPSAMAAVVGMPPTSMSRHVKAMQERGHVERSRGRDGRTAELRLTAAGLAVHRETHDAFQAANQRFLRDLPSTESEVRVTLARIRDAADSALASLGRDAAAQAG